MLYRCQGRAEQHVEHYVRKGIRVCKRWEESYEAFLLDVGPAPSKAHTLDRIDNAKGYEPGNVRWATKSEQERNKGTNRRVTIDGETKTMTEWAEKLGCSLGTLWARWNNGWRGKKLLTPVRKWRRRRSPELKSFRP